MRPSFTRWPPVLVRPAAECGVLLVQEFGLDPTESVDAIPLLDTVDGPELPQGSETRC